MSEACELCGRTTVPLTGHHLVPKARHNKKVKRELSKEQRNAKSMLCRPCHTQIHLLFTEKELERQYFTIDLLKTNERVLDWILWVSKRPTWGL